ncbi:DUF1353 domain-containing protein [Cellvibrio sp. QJXJ]|uniref:DUF1353 domain-containing protein n=1 Tax=Cellvibrio sp. QJXJ TaxID=2964606 RepID=UPI0021C4200B|nr:DUF1353 domain-containing protein [Cellvibrio sp. QJXJ]UUA73108.1 DUF1353 domain-containing protein [Cellvibrio sp. QJXJ]
MVKPEVRIEVEISSSSKWMRLLKPVTLQGHTIPAGFVTDLDSIRRIPLVYRVLKGRARVPALLHDYLYQIGYDRSEADDLFLAEMKRLNVQPFYTFLIYWGVRIFGKYFYEHAYEREKY